ncbi:XdhC family protein [Loktanella salsilacus]|uniref:XdhC family protein n=1 Tax=Loktanella salsilacus TaxID=195913 RepID=UPI003736B15C
MTPRQIMEHGLQDGTDVFAIATIVRTAGTTAAKPGAKALLRDDGTIIDGWLGGGCVKGAIKAATLRAYATGQPQLISVAPEEDLARQGVHPGDDRDGIHFARNGCPSKGTIDIFIEPHLPEPELWVIGASPVALKLSALAPHFGWRVTASAGDVPLPDRTPGRARYVVIATQGQGDLAALTGVLTCGADYTAFVGSARKYAALSAKLAAQGIAPEHIAAVHAPAGLNIGAVTPAEIALSILAQMTEAKRQFSAQTLHDAAS